MTTIQRQYSLPNCRLILQGVGNDADTASSMASSMASSIGSSVSGRPLLSMVTNVECYLAGQKTPITGGRAFLESLTTTVSRYAQSYLSGIQTLLRRDRREQTDLVQLEQIEENLHRLTVQPEDGSSGLAGTAAEIDLTTVQLFDLVEAVDQFFADAQTLPELGLKLDPVSKRHIKSAEPLTKRAGPAALGFSGLAAAAALLFMLPAPEVKRPETDGATTTEQPASPNPSPSSPHSSATTASSPASSTATASPSPEASTSASLAASPTANTETSATAGKAASAFAGLNLTSAPEITDPTELDRLTAQLYNKLDAEWQKKPSFEGELVYRVGVNPSGEIVGYKYSNDAALTYLSDIPLADVQFPTPADATASPTASPVAGSTSPIAQFRVVFKSDGVLEISPWAGKPSTESPSPSPLPSPSASP